MRDGVVKGPTFGPAPGGPSRLKHGYNSEIDATADAPVEVINHAVFSEEWMKGGE